MIKDAWVQEIAASLSLQTIDETITKSLCALVENEIRKIAGLAHKFQRRCRQNVLSVDHVNLALSSYGMEEIYGLSSAMAGNMSSKRKLASANLEESEESVAISKAAKDAGLVDLVELGKDAYLQPPSMPELELHWLAVEGVQPLIPENPIPNVKLMRPLDGTGRNEVQAGKEDQAFPILLSQEMQSFYHRCISVITTTSSASTGMNQTPPTSDSSGSSSSSSGGAAANLLLSKDTTIHSLCDIMRHSTGLQELVPYFIQYFTTCITVNLEHGMMLVWNVVRLIAALIQNPHLRLEIHVQVLLPAVLSVIVGARVGKYGENHWELRQYAASVVASVCRKYTAFIPDLTARVCKTYADCFLVHREVSTVYGGLAGLYKLGYLTVRSIILPKFAVILDILDKARLQLAELCTSPDHARPEEGAGAGVREPIKEDGRVGVLRESIARVEEWIPMVLGGYIQQCMLHASYGTETAGTGTLPGSEGAAQEELQRMRAKMRKMEQQIQALRKSRTGTGEPSRKNEPMETLEDGASRDAGLGVLPRNCPQKEDRLGDYAETLVPYYIRHAGEMDYGMLWV